MTGAGAAGMQTKNLDLTDPVRQLEDEIAMHPQGRPSAIAECKVLNGLEAKAPFAGLSDSDSGGTFEAIEGNTTRQRNARVA